MSRESQPIKNSLMKTQIAARPRAATYPLAAFSALLLLSTSYRLNAAPTEKDAVQTRTNIVTEAAAATSLRLRNATELTLASDLAQDAASGRALASADFDEDGVPDLVTSYDGARGPRLVVQRGNIDAIYPHSDEARARKQRGEFTSAAFHRAAGSLALPEAADFLGAGDFDADGHWDIVAARHGGTKLYWLRGDGLGNFAAPEAFDVLERSQPSQPARSIAWMD